MPYMRATSAFIVISIWSLVLCQTEQFEYECDILHRMSTLEDKLKASDLLITELQTKVQESEDRITELQNKVQESKGKIGVLQNQAQESEETIRAHQQTITVLQTNAHESDRAIKTFQQQLQEQVRAGSTYVRWGRTSCPGNGSELIYQGIAGGSWFNHAGGAAEYLCLPLNPEYRAYTEDTPQGGSGYVYGAEYQLSGRANRMKFFPDIDATPDLYDKNVPCVVCHVSRNTMIMIPTKRTCMDGWTREYDGLLVSGYFNHSSATEFICLDDQPEVLAAGEHNQDGKLFYFVEGRCGSLPCPHYVNGRELSCVVCTK